MAGRATFQIGPPFASRPQSRQVGTRRLTDTTFTMFSLPDNVVRFQEEVRNFAREAVAPGAAQRDRARQWFPEIWSEIGRRGWLGLVYPKEYGGAGLTTLHQAVMTEELAAV